MQRCIPPLLSSSAESQLQRLYVLSSSDLDVGSLAALLLRHCQWCLCRESRRISSAKLSRSTKPPPRSVSLRRWPSSTLSSAKVGRLLGSECQHWEITRNSSGRQWVGLSRRYPSPTLRITSRAPIVAYGVEPNNRPRYKVL